jgi:hypothetical protein
MLVCHKLVLVSYTYLSSYGPLCGCGCSHSMTRVFSYCCWMSTSTLESAESHSFQYVQLHVMVVLLLVFFLVSVPPPLYGSWLGSILLYILSWVLLPWYILYAILLFVWYCRLVYLQVVHVVACVYWFAGWVACCYYFGVSCWNPLCWTGCLTGVVAPSLSCMYIGSGCYLQRRVSLTSYCLGYFWLLWSLLFVCLRVALWRCV